jgi:hypothetical protein
VLKLTGEEWLEGSAIYYALRIDEFRVFPMVSDLVWQFTPAIVLGSWLALWVQLLLPLLVIWRPTRYVAVALITGMHLGIAVLLSLWPFSLAMIALDLLLVRDASWRRVGAWFAGAGRSIRRAVSDPGRDRDDRASAAGDHASRDEPSIEEPLRGHERSDFANESVPDQPSELQPAGRRRSGSAIRR